MGTTLTGTTPQTTYDSLIKVTDNGPLGGSLKTLTDGLGNDSALALSTGAASVTGTLAVSSNLTVDTDTLFVDAANNRVGIGTTSNYSFNDDAKLAVANTAGNSTISIVSSTSGIGYLAFADGTSGTDRYTGSINYNHSTNAMTLHTNAGNERMIITDTGAVGIGTSSPSELLHLSTTLAGSTGVGTAIQITSGGTGGDQAFIGVNKGAGNGLELSVENRDIIFNTGATTPFGGTERLRITSAGNVGIGTSSPESIVHIAQSNSGGKTTLYIDNNASSALNNAATIKFSVDSGASVSGGGAEISAINVNASNGDTDCTIKTFDSSVGLTEKVRITSAGNVGIGTSSPSRPLTVVSTQWDNSTGSGAIFSNSNSVGAGITLQPSASVVANGPNGWALYAGGPSAAIGDGNLGFWAHGTNDARMVIQRGGNVGIGTSSPTSKLVVNGDIATSGNIALTGSGAGIFLGGSIGSANGLDDYEEGTWTMGISFVGGTTGITYSANTGTYTKIGRQVTVNGYIALTSKGSATGEAFITGLPFTIPNSLPNFSSASIWLYNISYGGLVEVYGQINSSYLRMGQLSEAGTFSIISDANFANNSEIMISFTYFV